MKKLSLHAFAISFILTAVFSTAAVASAQTVPPTPALYNQTDVLVNPNGSALIPGWYYNLGGQSVYYYGDGTYYNPENGIYYGLNGSMMSVSNPAVVPAELSGSAVVPSAPNTGAGGEASANIIALVVSGLLAAAGITYLLRGTASRKTLVA